jgi:hypothetical protein
LAISQHCNSKTVGKTEKRTVDKAQIISKARASSLRTSELVVEEIQANVVADLPVNSRLQPMCVVGVKKAEKL